MAICITPFIFTVNPCNWERFRTFVLNSKAMKNGNSVDNFVNLEAGDRGRYQMEKIVFLYVHVNDEKLDNL